MSETKNDIENPVQRLVSCRHNARCRYTCGFYCEDCGKFFSKDSPTYRSGELLSAIWMVLDNINVDRARSGLEVLGDIVALKEEIEMGMTHKNYEDIIFRAEVLMRKHGKNSESASVVLHN